MSYVTAGYMTRVTPGERGRSRWTAAPRQATIGAVPIRPHRQRSRRGRPHVCDQRDRGHVPGEHQPGHRNGIARAGQTLRNLDWFELVSVRGAIADGRVTHYQVTMKVGMRLDDAG